MPSWERSREAEEARSEPSGLEGQNHRTAEVAEPRRTATAARTSTATAIEPQRTQTSRRTASAALAHPAKENVDVPRATLRFAQRRNGNRESRSPRSSAFIRGSRAV